MQGDIDQSFKPRGRKSVRGELSAAYDGTVFLNNSGTHDDGDLTSQDPILQESRWRAVGIDTGRDNDIGVEDGQIHRRAVRFCRPRALRTASISLSISS